MNSTMLDVYELKSKQSKEEAAINTFAVWLPLAEVTKSRV